MNTETRDMLVYYGIVAALIVMTVVWALALLALLGTVAAWVIGTAIPGVIEWADANPNKADAVLIGALAFGALAAAEARRR